MTSTNLPGFTHIGPRTSLYSPHKSENGQLIVLCTWLGAERKHIAKYVALYQNIAPEARILLIESSVSIMISSYVSQRRQIQSAVSAVLDTLADCGQYFLPVNVSVLDQDADALSRVPSAAVVQVKTPQILLQTFSNGGTNSATHLLTELQQRLRRPLPLVALICDSGPADANYWKSYDAMLLSLPRDTLSRALGAIACHLILILVWSWVFCGNEHPNSFQRRVLIEESFIAGSPAEAETGGVGREDERVMCLIYSKADLQCAWEDIASQADDARKQGWHVEEVVLDGSQHCAHLLKHQARYTEVVRSMWQGEPEALAEKSDMSV